MRKIDHLYFLSEKGTNFKEFYIPLRGKEKLIYLILRRCTCRKSSVFKELNGRPSFSILI